MAFLGVGFYAGLVATSPDMLDSLDKYVDTSNLYDVSIVSTLGLTDEDVDKVKEIEGLENVYAVQSKDSIAKIDDKESLETIVPQGFPSFKTSKNFNFNMYISER